MPLGVRFPLCSRHKVFTTFLFSAFSSPEGRKCAPHLPFSPSPFGRKGESAHSKNILSFFVLQGQRTKETQKRRIIFSSFVLSFCCVTLQVTQTKGYSIFLFFFCSFQEQKKHTNRSKYKETGQTTKRLEIDLRINGRVVECALLEIKFI